jgi:hypothetical protein
MWYETGVMLKCEPKFLNKVESLPIYKKWDWQADQITRTIFNSFLVVVVVVVDDYDDDDEDDDDDDDNDDDGFWW